VAISPLPTEFPGVEEMMAQRGVLVSYETIRAWCRTFGPVYAEGLRRRQPRRGDRWHLDEVFLTINGTRQYLWRAVDQDGNVLDILVTPLPPPGGPSPTCCNRS
jgi:putative transposase